MSRKNRRERKDARTSEAPEPVPPTAPNPAPAPSTRPGVVVAIVAGLAVLVAGGVFLAIKSLRGPSGPNPRVVIETSEGPITVELFEHEAPITVENFLKYVDRKHYDGTIFHRVIPNFMIQGGGFEPGLKEKLPQSARAGIQNESYNGLKNERGTLAMARTPKPDSATDQFFINLKYNDFLDRAKARDGVGYAVFGKVIDGMGVVDRIAAVPTADRDGHENVPVKDVLIKSVRRVQSK